MTDRLKPLPPEDGPCFSPVDRAEHELGCLGYDVPDYCHNCGKPFMDHVNSRCPRR